MYIAICDDQVDELESLTSLLLKWQSERQTTCRFKTFRNAAELLDAAKTRLSICCAAPFSAKRNSCRFSSISKQKCQKNCPFPIQTCAPCSLTALKTL